jgi:hypothetical protein
MLALQTHIVRLICNPLQVMILITSHSASAKFKIPNIFCWILCVTAVSFISAHVLHLALWQKIKIYMSDLKRNSAFLSAFATM